MKKYILDPKRNYERTSDGEINPSREELGLTPEEYDDLCSNNSAYIAQVALFNMSYRQKMATLTVKEKERKRLKLIDHWFKTIDKIYLHDMILRNMPKGIEVAISLAESANNHHFRSYYYESVERIKPHNLKIPTAVTDVKLLGFPSFDGTSLYGTPTQFFKMYMTFFPPLKRKRKELVIN